MTLEKRRRSGSTAGVAGNGIDPGLCSETADGLID